MKSQQQIAERAVVEQQRAQRLAVDRDVAHRLRSTTAVRYTVWPDSRFSSPRNPGGAVAHDLVAGGVQDRHLALDDRDERIALVADPEEHVADGRGALLAVLARASPAATRREAG